MLILERNDVLDDVMRVWSEEHKLVLFIILCGPVPSSAYISQHESTRLNDIGLDPVIYVGVYADISETPRTGAMSDLRPSLSSSMWMKLPRILNQEEEPEQTDGRSVRPPLTRRPRTLSGAAEPQFNGKEGLG